MRLLIVTQKVDKDDENLGFFHRWIEEFSKQCKGVTVISGALGKHELPVGVEILSLGKEEGSPRIKRRLRFLKYFRSKLLESDAIFFHMCPEFVLASAPVLIFYKKPSALWYVHKSVTWKLKLAERLVDWIFTASDLSFRLPSKKVIYTGHAIDTDQFSNKFQTPRPFGARLAQFCWAANSKTVRLLTAGRISPVKDLETVIRSCAILKEKWNRQWVLSVIGGPYLPRDHDYFASLKSLVKERGLESFVIFEGAHPYTEMPELYDSHDIFLSMSRTGSIDKSVLEAMACGLTVITANEAFQSLLPPKYFLEKRSPEFLAERIKSLADEPRPNMSLRELVVRNHSLRETIQKILDAYSRL